MIEILLKILFGLLPVLMYLGALVLLDSYKLVTLRAVVTAVAAGCMALLGCRYLNSYLFAATHLDTTVFTLYVAPITEEAVKALYVALLIRGRRVGFIVDAAIIGFAVGAGFGILENVFYLSLIPDAGLFTWVLRGCGTALMHGSTAAVFAILAHRHFDRGGSVSWWQLAPGLAVAVLLHSAYNHFFVSPVLTVVGLVGGVPLITLLVFGHSERALERWLGLGFDSDAEFLAVIDAGEVTGTRVGAYLVSLRERFPPTVVADMLCLVRLQAELAIQAKGLLLMRKEGFDVPTPTDAPQRLAELKYLERSIGPTGRLALRPFLRRGRRESWQQHLLGQR